MPERVIFGVIAEKSRSVYYLRAVAKFRTCVPTKSSYILF